jgi:MYXO-CTERM domain-containing protein
LAAALSSTAPAWADKVLVYQQQNNESGGADEAGPNAAAVLEGLGHTVTKEISLTATLPADLSAYDTVWHISASPISGVDQTTFVNYVNGGGGLYLTGENYTCCKGVNADLQAIVNRLVPDIINFTGLDQFEDEWVASTDTWGITKTPNLLPTWPSVDPGGIYKVPVENRVYQHPSSDAVGSAAWSGEGLTQGAGCLYVAMDSSYWLSKVNIGLDRAPFAENVQRFLRTCADSDQDGLTDVGEEEAGTDPESPDSDGDGLCDGYGAVPGACVSGESVLLDSDEDELSNPLDTDDDNDGISTKDELAAELKNPNGDDDKRPTWLDVDSDNNNIPDFVEGLTDFDGDGIASSNDLGDDPENCDEDADCEAQPGSIGCNQETGFCASAGAPIPGGTGGAGNEPAFGGASQEPGGAGEPSRGGTKSSSGTGEAGAASGNARGGEGGTQAGRSGDASDSGGCGCSVPGRSGGSFAVLAVAVLWLMRRRR